MRWRKIILNNLWLKILALVISAALWALYTHEPFAEVAYNVPIVFINVPQGLAVSGDTPPAVHVLIRGRSGLLQRIVPGDLNVSVDMQKMPAGDDPIRITRRMVRVPYGTTVVDVTPPRFKVALVTNASPPPDAE